MVNKKSAKLSFSDVSSSLGEITKLEAGFAIFFVVGAKTECPYVGHKSKLVSKWSFQAKIQCKNNGFLSSNLRKVGVPYSVFYSQASN